MKQEKDGEEPKEKSASNIKLEILSLRQKLEELEDALTQTREVAVLGSQSLPFLASQIKQVLAENETLRAQLLFVQDEAAKRFTSLESAMRENARLEEENVERRKLLELLAKKYREVSDENAYLKIQKQQLEKKLEVQEQIIQGVSTLITEIRQLMEKRKLPPDVIADLKKILPEIPRPIPEIRAEEIEGKGEEEIYPP